MNLHLKKPRLSPTLFALFALTFVLPFATVSCNGADTRFTGFQLVTRTVPAGGAIKEGGCGDISNCVEGQGSTLAEIALAAALIGLLLGVFGRGKGPGWCAITGLLAMLWIGWKSVEPLGPEVTFHSGYWLALMLLAWAAGLHAERAVRRRRAGSS